MQDVRVLALGAGETWLPIFHTACGQVAFYSNRRFKPGAPMLCEHIQLLDGSRPAIGTPMLCGSCGQCVWPGRDLAYEQDESDHAVR